MARIARRRIRRDEWREASEVERGMMGTGGRWLRVREDGSTTGAPGAGLRLPCLGLDPLSVVERKHPPSANSPHDVYAHETTVHSLIGPCGPHDWLGPVVVGALCLRGRCTCCGGAREVGVYGVWRRARWGCQGGGPIGGRVSGGGIWYRGGGIADGGIYGLAGGLAAGGA